MGPSLSVLLVAQSMTLAHLVRLAVLAGSLREAGHRPLLACPLHFRAALTAPPCPLLPLAGPDPDTFLARLGRGGHLLTADELVAMEEEDHRLFALADPDLVVGDFRLSLGVSTRRAGLPYAALLNAYWNPAAPSLPWPAPDLWLERLLGASALNRGFSLLQPWLRRVHAAPYDRLRIRHGMPAMGDVRAVYADADLLLHPDPPELAVLADGGPPHARIGHLPWSPAITALPSWWSDLPPGRACIYICLGSSGAIAALDNVCAGAAAIGLPVVCATAGRAHPNPRPGLHVADWLPGDELARRALVVVCNGGSPSSYQALAGGAPVLAIPANLDQQLCARAVERAGAGRILRRRACSPSRVTLALADIITDAGLARRAGELAGRMAQEDAGAAVVVALERLAQGGRRTVPQASVG